MMISKVSREKYRREGSRLSTGEVYRRQTELNETFAFH